MNETWVDFLVITKRAFLKLMQVSAPQYYHKIMPGHEPEERVK